MNDAVGSQLRHIVLTYRADVCQDARLDPAGVTSSAAPPPCTAPVVRPTRALNLRAAAALRLIAKDEDGDHDVAEWFDAIERLRGLEPDRAAEVDDFDNNLL